MKILTCQNVSFGYENKAVVRDVSFDIESGNFLSILGENGTGKSTLIKGILGLLSPSNGKIEYHISRNEIGYLPQQVKIRKGFPATVREVIMSGLLSKQRFGWGKQKEKREQCEKAAELCGVKDLLSRAYCELSVGQQQRVLIARAIVADCRLLILDEPMASLDANSTEALYQILFSMCKDGVAVMLITHDINEALKYSDKILHMDHVMRFFGTTQEYMQSEIFSMWRGTCL